MTADARQRLFCAAFLGLLGIGALAFLYAYDPRRIAFFPKCPFLALTGLQCPGCGTTRALHAALHGRLLEAVRFNPILVVAVPFVVALACRPQWAMRPVVGWAFLAAVLVWWLLRNCFGV